MKIKANIATHKVMDDLAKVEGKVQDEVLDLVNESLLNIETQAKRNAPNNLTRLRGAIHANPATNKEAPFGTVEVSVHYAPYIEFGTGAFASAYLSSKDMELRQYAMNFYVNGKGRMPAHPYLFPAFWAEIPKIQKALAQLVKKLK